MTNELQMLIKNIKTNYDRWTIKSFDCTKSPTKGGILQLTIDKDDLIYICPGHGIDIGVYTKEGKLIETISKFNYDSIRKVSPFYSYYDNKINALLINDLWNFRTHVYDLKKKLIVKTLGKKEYDVRSSLDNFEEPAYIKPLTKKDLNEIGMIIILSAIRAENCYYFLSRKINEENKPNMLIISRVSENFEFIEDILSIECSQYEANLYPSINYNEKLNKIYFMFSGKQIYTISIDGKSKSLLFDAEKLNYCFSSICVTDRGIYLTDVKDSEGRLVKISLEGKFIYEFKHEEIKSPTCVTSHKDNLYLVSRGNNKIVIMERQHE